MGLLVLAKKGCTFELTGLTLELKAEEGMLSKRLCYLYGNEWMLFEG